MKTLDKKYNEVVAKIHDDLYKIEVKVESGGKMPSKVRQTDAGFDLYATEDIALYPGEVVKHPLNIRMKLPAGTWAEITTKSGLGSKGQLVYAGVIDADYRGIPHVVMTNLKMTSYVDSDGVMVANNEPLLFKKGEKIAQLIMSPYSVHYYMTEVEEVDTNTSRGEGGFGSTGLS